MDWGDVEYVPKIMTNDDVVRPTYFDTQNPLKMMTVTVPRFWRGLAEKVRSGGLAHNEKLLHLSKRLLRVFGCWISRHVCDERFLSFTTLKDYGRGGSFRYYECHCWSRISEYLHFVGHLGEMKQVKPFEFNVGVACIQYEIISKRCIKCGSGACQQSKQREYEISCVDGTCDSNPYLNLECRVGTAVTPTFQVQYEALALGYRRNVSSSEGLLAEMNDRNGVAHCDVCDYF